MSRVMLFLFVVLPGVAVLGLWLALDRRPLVEREVELSPAHVARAHELLRRHDPRAHREGQASRVRLSREDLELLANHALSRFGHGGADVLLEPGRASLTASVVVPANPFGRYLNLRADLDGTDDWPRLTQVRLGRLRVPPAVAEAVLRDLGRRWVGGDAGALLRETVDAVRFGAGNLDLVYTWRADLPARLRQVALPAAEQARLRDYHARLAAVALPEAGAIGLETLLAVCSTRAAERAQDGDAVRENRAALVALALQVNGNHHLALFPDARLAARLARRIVLHERHDLVQHFISAALAAAAGTPLAEVVGLYKELADADGGSGFSFSDLAADWAGTRFGDVATASTTDAIRLQQRAAAGLAPADFMPSIEGLPDGLQAAEFEQRFGNPDSTPYQRMIAEIDRRIAACALYRPIE